MPQHLRLKSFRLQYHFPHSTAEKVLVLVIEISSQKRFPLLKCVAFSDFISGEQNVHSAFAVRFSFEIPHIVPHPRHQTTL